MTVKMNMIRKTVFCAAACTLMLCSLSTAGGPHPCGPFPPEVLKTFVNVRDYGAKGDGKTDDTQAILAAMAVIKEHADLIRTERHLMNELIKVNVLYFPEGVYRVSDTLTFHRNIIEPVYAVVLGDGRDQSVIRLDDSTEGYQNPKKPKALFCFHEGPWSAESYWNSVINISLDAGGGNPGAIALDYTNSNNGRIENVLITAGEDSGYKGLSIDRGVGGPAMIRYLTVRGFDIGISCTDSGAGAVTFTFEHIDLMNQRQCGVLVRNRPVQFYQLTSAQSRTKSVGIKVDGPAGQVVIIDSKFKGGFGFAKNAIEVDKDSFAYLRNIRTLGYSAILKDEFGTVYPDPANMLRYGEGADGGNVLAGHGENYNSHLQEYIGGKVYKLWADAPSSSLNLEIKETPVIPWETDFSKWAIVDVTGVPREEHADKIQEAIDSGKPCVYLLPEVYHITKTIYIRGDIQRLVGGWGSVYPDDEVFKSAKIVWHIDKSIKNDFIFENMTRVLPKRLEQEGIYIQNDSPHTVILKSLCIPINMAAYRNGPGAGDLYIDDVSNHYGRGMVHKPEGVWVFKNQKVWARNINPEQMFPHIINDGGQLWIMGFKVGEFHGPWFVTRNGGKTEVLGGCMNAQDYMKPVLPMDPAAIVVEDSQMSFIGLETFRDFTIAHPCMVIERQGDIERRLKHEHLPRVRAFGAATVPMYRSAVNLPQQ